MLSIQAVRGLPRLRAPGIVPGIISFSRQLPCFLKQDITISLRGNCVSLCRQSMVLFFGRRRSEGWPHHGRSFSTAQIAVVEIARGGQQSVAVWAEGEVRADGAASSSPSARGFVERCTFPQRGPGEAFSHSTISLSRGSLFCYAMNNKQLQQQQQQQQRPFNGL